MTRRGKGVVIGIALGALLSLSLLSAERRTGDAVEATAGSTVPNSVFKEERWVFDFVDRNIRFSHGNHKNRDRWFKRFFQSEYRCGVCHNTSLPVEGPDGVQLTEGEALETMDEIRAHKFFPFPYGVKMTTCLASCHNNEVAPGNCDWCHVPGSKPVPVASPEPSAQR